jgi:hypothetical protein
MVGGDRHGRRPYDGSSHRKVSPTLTHRAMMDPPQPGIVGVWVTSRLMMLLTWPCLSIVTLAIAYCLVQGFLGGGNRANGDCKVAGATPGPGEETR